MMAAAGSGAVFFLGTRAHYQVLQQPETQYDVENGNVSAETIYQNPSVQGLWNKDHQMDNYMNGGGNYCSNGSVPEEKDNGVKRRGKRRSSETALCEEMKPAALNNVDNNTPKSRRSRVPLLAFLTSLSRRKKKLHNEQLQHLSHLETKLLTTCTYRESCRCLECQSRYFECDEEEEDYSNSEDDSEYLHYLAQAMHPPPPPVEEIDDDDDEVFVDKIPEDSTSADMLLETKMSVSSTETDQEPDTMNIEVAAGTPVLLNYLLTHPITCAIQ